MLVIKISKQAAAHNATRCDCVGFPVNASEISLCPPSVWRAYAPSLGLLARYDCRIQLLVLMYPINSLESSGFIATLMSESKTGIVPFRQNYTPQDKRSCKSIVSCKWAVTRSCSSSSSSSTSSSSSSSSSWAQRGGSRGGWSPPFSGSVWNFLDVHRQF